MFWGLISRWMIPLWCRWQRAATISMISLSASSTPSLPALGSKYLDALTRYLSPRQHSIKSLCSSYCWSLGHPDRSPNFDAWFTVETVSPALRDRPVLSPLLSWDLLPLLQHFFHFYHPVHEKPRWSIRCQVYRECSSYSAQCAFGGYRDLLFGTSRYGSLLWADYIIILVMGCVGSKSGSGGSLRRSCPQQHSLKYRMRGKVIKNCNICGESIH